MRDSLWQQLLTAGALQDSQRNPKWKSMSYSPHLMLGETLPLAHICCVVPIFPAQQGLGWE